MKTQVNIFNKGINSDLSPMYIASDVWAFPTINARIYNTGSGFAMTNLPGNTNENMLDQKGAEILLKERYSLIGAIEIGGVAFLCSVSMDSDRLEIGCFPSPTGNGFQRVYSPLHNMNGSNPECNIRNSTSYNWSPKYLLRIEGKVEYDNSVNLYICSGHDLLRIVNSAFDVTTGSELLHRNYNRSSFEEATRNINTPAPDIIRNILSSSNIRIIEEGGTLPYGLYIIYVRFSNGTEDTTPWAYETPPIVIGEGTASDSGKYREGRLFNTPQLSEQYIEVDILVTDAYRFIEIGYSYRGSNNAGENLDEHAILSERVEILEGETSKTIQIQTTSGDATLEWDYEDNLKTIELIPQDIWSMNNILYQAGMSNESIDINIIRDFFKRVKLKCKVHQGNISMPSDGKVLEFEEESKFRILRIESQRTIIVNHGTVDTPIDTPTEFYLHSEDEIILAEEDEGDVVAISFNDEIADLHINGNFVYTSRTADTSIYTAGYKYVFDVDVTEFDDYELYSNLDGDNFTLKYVTTPTLYIYESTERYDKEYIARGDTTGTVTIIEKDVAYFDFTYETVPYQGFYYFYWKPPINNMWVQPYWFVPVDPSSTVEPRQLLIQGPELQVQPAGHGQGDAFFGSKETFNITQNDGYYSTKEHIIEDVGYFGGEIYSYSGMAEDRYGVKYGPFPLTGIDHYYAQNLADLEYTAYEEDNGVFYAKPTEDVESSYSTSPGHRMFTKNRQGIYRFPCRANYVKKLDSHNRLIKEEDKSNKKENYDNDIFNLTQRISYGSDNYNFLNIFKIAVDFTEAYNWLAQVDPTTNEESQDHVNDLINFRNNIIKITILRAERTDSADNLIAQGIIQKPNTILPFPKFFEYETLDLPDTTRGMYDHKSFEKLISYNFETIINNTVSRNSYWGENSSAVTLNLHGQLGNSSIKMYDADAQNTGDVSYPPGIKNMKTINGQSMVSAKAFIYSGKFAYHHVDFMWDNHKHQNIQEFPHKLSNWYSPPALGAICFSSYTFKGIQERAAYTNQIDWIWGEMSSQNLQYAKKWGMDIFKYNSFPQQGIFADNVKGPKKKWYDFHGILDIWTVGSKGFKGQYCGIPQYPLSLAGGSIKIPFFKGYMPCLHRSGRSQENTNTPYAITKFYTTRCMYHPYDLTRAFISPDLKFTREPEGISKHIKFIKPLRKTIYTGLEGIVGAGSTPIAPDINITKSYFRSDGWKTFFAKPNIMAFSSTPIYTTTSDAYKNAVKWRKDHVIAQGHTLNDFFLPPAISDSGISKNINPPSLLHAVRKYFKIDSQRECIPAGSVDYIDNINPNNIKVNHPAQGLHSIDGNKSIVKNYINYAWDFTGGLDDASGITLNRIKPNDYLANTDTAFENQKANPEMRRCLFACMDSKVTGYQRKGFYASNRTFKIMPYFAIELNKATHDPSKEYPSVDASKYDPTDYRYMRDYTDYYYDKTVELSSFTQSGINFVNVTNKGQTEVDSLTDGANGSLIRNVRNQYDKQDIYIDYNYEDLTLVNLYKVNPETIIDITDFYTYYANKFHVIGQVLATDLLKKPNDANPNREIVIGRGDCFLDRTYIKHTQWLPTNLNLGTKKFGEEDWSGNMVKYNWEANGAPASGSYGIYAPYFTAATTSYAHGTTLGLITENRFNLALRGGMDDKTFNSYPKCENMPNDNKKELDNHYRRKNLFLIYPESTSTGFNWRESLAYNTGYHNVLGSIFYSLENDTAGFIQNKYPNRIRWSHYALEESYQDGWRIFDIKDYQDYTSKYGATKRIMDINGTLISFMPDGILQHHYEGTDVKIGPDDRQILSVGGMKVLSRDTNLLSDVGLSHKFGLVKTSKGIYGINTEKNSIWNVGSQVDEHGRTQLGASPLSKSAGIHNWTKEYIQDIRSAENLPIDVTNASTKIPDTIYDGLGVTAAFDSEYNEVLFTFVNRFKSYTLCYSEMIEKFVSLYTFAPYMYFNINNNLYSVKHSQRDGNEARHIYRHNNEYSHKQKFYGSFYKNDFALSIISNGISGEENLSIFAKQFQAQVIESQQEPFTTVRYETQDQVAEHPFIDTENWWSVPEYLSHHWQVPVQLDNISGDDDEDMFYGDSSMLGGWLKTTLTYTADSRNKDIHIQSILTSFNISQS